MKMLLANPLQRFNLIISSFLQANGSFWRSRLISARLRRPRRPICIQTALTKGWELRSAISFLKAKSGFGINRRVPGTSGIKHLSPLSGFATAVRRLVPLYGWTGCCIIGQAPLMQWLEVIITRISPSVWPEKNCQMSIKFAQKWFH